MKKEDNYLNDNELDAVFRVAAQQEVPDFQKSDWEAMVQKIEIANIEYLTKKRIQKRWILGILLGFLFIGSTVWTISEKTKLHDSLIIKTNSNDIINKLNGTIKNQKKGLINNRKKDEISSHQNLINSTKYTDNENINKRDAERTITTKVFSDLKGNETALNNFKAEKKQGEKEMQQSRTLRSISDSSLKTNLISTKQVNENKVANIQISERNNNAVETKTSGEEIVKSNEGDTKTPFPFVGLLENKSKVYFQEIPLPVINFPSSKVQDVSELSSKQLSKKEFSIRIAYSPDFSTVNSNFLKVGNNSAFLIEYRLVNRFVLQSGVIKSVKKYSASPANYAWPEKWGVMPVNLLNIDATCDMLDVPLNIRYDFNTQRIHRYFVTLGSTSYFMLNEIYHYNYSSSPGKWIKWEGETGFYSFGTVNISTGYERTLSKKISLQIEPFAKLPVKNLGFGKVKLTTIGVFASASIKL